MMFTEQVLSALDVIQSKLINLLYFREWKYLNIMLKCTSRLILATITAQPVTTVTKAVLSLRLIKMRKNQLTSRQARVRKLFRSQRLTSHQARVRKLFRSRVLIIRKSADKQVIVTRRRVMRTQIR